MASYPNHCHHIKINGTQCGSPALRRNRFCFFHKRFQDERIKLSADRARRGTATFVLPVLEDANSIQVALMQVMRLLISQQMDHKTASLILYALQTACSNLRQTNFKPFCHDVVLDPRDVANTPFDSHIWEDEDFDDEEEEDDDVTEGQESPADRAIRSLEENRKKKEEDAKWMRWAEMQYPKTKPPATQSAAVTPSGNALVSPASSAKKLPTPTVNAEKVRKQIHDLVRKEFFPGMPDSMLQKK
ncbi:MAG: hypothetical protein WA485_16420 [Candidatus Sulfotelmatobacter sp.]